jgi:DNA-binding response OmpR family regulator
MQTAVCPCCGSVVDQNQLADDVELADVVDRLGLQRQPAILFLMLFKAAGRTLTKDTLIDAVEAARPDQFLSSYALRSTIVRINARLKGLPVKVTAVCGIGYRMDRHNAMWDWRDLPILPSDALGERRT